MGVRFTPFRFLTGVSRSILWFVSTSLDVAGKARTQGETTSLDYVYASTLSRGFTKYLRLKHEIHHEERLTAAQPCVYVVNHRSNLDLITLSRVFPPDTIVIGKKQVLKVPLFGKIFEQGGNISIDRTNSDDARAGFAEAERAIVDKRRSIWVFPEGTRNHGKALLPFKKGAFHLARNAGVPVVPIVCSVPNRWVEGKKLFLAKETKVVIEVLEPIDSTAFESVEALASHAHTMMKEALERLQSFSSG